MPRRRGGKPIEVLHILHQILGKLGFGHAADPTRQLARSSSRGIPLGKNLFSWSPAGKTSVSFARQSLGSLLALIFGVAASILLPRILAPEARGE